MNKNNLIYEKKYLFTIDTYLEFCFLLNCSSKLQNLNSFICSFNCDWLSLGRSPKKNYWVAKIDLVMLNFILKSIDWDNQLRYFLINYTIKKWFNYVNWNWWPGKEEKSILDNPEPIEISNLNDQGFKGWKYPVFFNIVCNFE